MKKSCLSILLFSAIFTCLFSDSPYILRNTIIAGPERSAIIENIDTNEAKLITVGDYFNEYQVNTIQPYQVSLQSTTSKITLFLHSRFVSSENISFDINSEEHLSKLKFQWPSEKTSVISGFGYRQHPLGGGVLFHKGLDIPLPRNTPVYAANSGVVKFAGRRSSYGILLIVYHPRRYQSYYAHLSAIKVKPGDFVSTGDLVAYSGNTGRSTGPHLHFEIRKDGIPVDPLKYLPKNP